MRDRHPTDAGASRRPIAARLLLRSLLALAIPVLSLAILPASAGAADGLTMEGRAMLAGHTSRIVTRGVVRDDDFEALVRIRVVRDAPETLGESLGIVPYGNNERHRRNELSILQVVHLSR